MKKILFSLLALLLISMPQILHTQNWTPEEELILEKAKTFLFEWQEAVNNKDLSIWLDAVEPMDDWHAWWTSDGSLWSLEDTKRNFEFFVKDIVKYQAINVNPIRIKISDNVAVIWYYLVFAREYKDGNTITYEEKRFDVFLKVDGNWRMSASMIDRKTIDF